MTKGFIKSPQIDQGKNIFSDDGASNKTPVWCFTNLRNGWSFEDLPTPKDHQSFTQRLRLASGRTWGELRRLGRKNGGVEYAKISGLKKFKGGSQSVSTSDQIAIFRFKGKDGRIAGVQVGQVMHVIWIDHNLSLYKH